MASRSSFCVPSSPLPESRAPTERRLMMLKVLGLNSVAVYLFWNHDNPEPGQFDWMGMADAAAYRKLKEMG